MSRHVRVANNDRAQQWRRIMKTILHLSDVAASPEKVFAALTSTDGLAALA